MKKEEYELKRIIEELKRIRGRGTELISLYIPQGYPLPEITNKLRYEYSQASNIKSKSTRKNVLDALERILQHLKIYKQTPKNGLAIFCGNISQEPGNPDIELFVVQPPYPIQVQLYRCDSTFFLEPLERMLEKRELYGIVTVSRGEAAIAKMKGKYLEIVRTFESGVHAKHHKGGQSAARFERQIDEETKRFYRKVAEAMKEIFLPELKELKGIILGGPGPTKEYFLKDAELDYRLKEKIIGMIDTGYADESGIKEAFEKSASIIAGQELVEEKKLLDRFMKEIAREGLATYGLSQVFKALLEDRASKVIVSEALKLEVWHCTCGCGFETVSKNKMERCPNCNSELSCELKNVIDLLVRKCEEKGVEIEIVSDSTSEGKQFLLGFGGIGAFLRYKL